MIRTNSFDITISEENSLTYYLTRNVYIPLRIQFERKPNRDAEMTVLRKVSIQCKLFHTSVIDENLHLTN